MQSDYQISDNPDLVAGRVRVVAVPPPFCSRPPAPGPRHQVPLRCRHALCLCSYSNCTQAYSTRWAVPDTLKNYPKRAGTGRYLVLIVPNDEHDPRRRGGPQRLTTGLWKGWAQVPADRIHTIADLMTPYSCAWAHTPPATLRSPALIPGLTTYRTSSVSSPLHSRWSITRGSKKNGPKRPGTHRVIELTVPDSELDGGGGVGHTAPPRHLRQRAMGGPAVIDGS